MAATAERLVKQLESSKEFFMRTISVLTEADSNFKPTDDVYTVAAQIAHTAITVDWFIDGAFVNGHFDMDFEKADKAAKAVTSVAVAKKMIEDSYARAAKVVGALSDAELFAPMPLQGIMDGAPRMACVGGIADHTAHHRGSLAVYVRLVGKVPPMPYM